MLVIRKPRMRDFPLGADPLNISRVLFFSSDKEKYAYIDAAFSNHKDYVESQV